MNKEQQRILIAEFCGWLIHGCAHENSGHRYSAPLGTSPFLGRHALPDYLNDLNAMHEAEEKLHASFQQSEMFVHRIEQVVYKTKSSGIGIKFATINATAAQRAEALLRTIGKWQTEKEPNK
jgi:hypothetical protein